MPNSGPLDFLPIWGIFLTTVVLVVLSVEGGFRLGKYRRRRSDSEDKPPVGEMVAATLALLALLLAFTFGLAASRFDVRRGLVIEEANAIGTTYLRAKMLPEPNRTEIQKLLREYVDVRLEAVQPDGLSESIHRSEELLTQLWSQTVVVGEKNPSSIVVGLFIASLNDVIDLHTKRLALGVRNRIPGPIWATLYLVAIIGTSVMGYHAGLAGSDRSLAILALVFAFSSVMTLIADLDRPQEGLLRVGQQAIVDLRKSFETKTGLDENGNVGRKTAESLF